MPFASEAQRRLLWARRPDVARKFQAHTPESAQLPEKAAQGRRAAISGLRRRLRGQRRG